MSSFGDYVERPINSIYTYDIDVEDALAGTGSNLESIETTEFDTEKVFRVKRSVIDEYKKFRNICKKKDFKIEQAWSQEIIPEVNPLELDMEVHSERIIFIISRMLRKLEAVGCIPAYMKDQGAILRKYLPPDQADFIIHLLVRRSVTSNRKSRPSRSALPVSLRLIMTKVPGLFLDPDLQQIVQYLTVNKCLELIQQTKKIRVTNRIQEIIDLIRNLVTLASKTLLLTAGALRARNKKLRSAYEYVSERTPTIKKIEETLQEKSLESDIKIKEKEIAIKELKMKIRRVRLQFKVNSEHITKNSEANMTLLVQYSDRRQEILAEQAKVAQQYYFNLLGDHLEEEKKLRSNRLKIEYSLANWINKFDQEILDRQAQWDELEERYDDESKQFLELQCLFKEQEETYERCKDVRLDYAATRIQRYWKAYAARRLAEKKPKHDKPKKKPAKRTRKW